MSAMRINCKHERVPLIIFIEAFFGPQTRDIFIVKKWYVSANFNIYLKLPISDDYLIVTFSNSCLTL